MAGTLLSKLPDDVVLNILFKLEEDPRNWARLACSCTKFSSMIRNVCWKTKCYKVIPSVVSDLLTDSTEPTGSWAAFHKLAVCCPGARSRQELPEIVLQSGRCISSGESSDRGFLEPNWHESGVYNDSEAHQEQDNPQLESTAVEADQVAVENDVVRVGGEFSICKKRKVSRPMRSHLASRVWNLSREQGNKLLHSRFRSDRLYICDWPGYVHIKEKRNYILFRGIFKDFKGSQVWRTIKDGNRSKINLKLSSPAPA